MASVAASATIGAPSGLSTGSTSSHTYAYATSKIVRVAVAAGIIVLFLTALLLFFKISSWVRFRQRLRRQHTLTSLLEAEQEAKAFEIAAWADEPGQAPIRGASRGRVGRYWWGGKKTVKKKVKGQKRGRTNAHAVHEWEGVPA